MESGELRFEGRRDLSVFVGVAAEVVCKAHRLLNHSILGLRVIKKKRRVKGRADLGVFVGVAAEVVHQARPLAVQVLVFSRSVKHAAVVPPRFQSVTWPKLHQIWT